MMAVRDFPPQMRPSMPPWMPIGAPPMSQAGMSHGKHQHQQGGHGPGDFVKAAGDRHGPGDAEMQGRGKEWQLALALLSTTAKSDVGSGEWQLALALLSGMDVGSGEWQLALALLSGMDVGSGEWQLALGLLSVMDVGSGE